MSSNQETNRDKVLRREVVKVADSRLSEMQAQAISGEGVSENEYHWHWAAIVNELIARRADETSRDDARDAARYRWLRANAKHAVTLTFDDPDSGHERSITWGQVSDALDESIDKALASLPEEPARELSPSEAASFNKTLARSPRRVKEPEAVRAGVSVKDPTPPQDIILCAAMGPSGFICERPKGHPGRHCDGDNRSWSSEKANAFKCVCGEMHTLGDGHVCKSQKSREHHPRCELMQPHGHEPPKCTCSGLNGKPEHE